MQLPLLRPQTQPLHGLSLPLAPHWQRALQPALWQHGPPPLWLLLLPHVPRLFFQLTSQAQQPAMRA
jgi:hypothetical protein